ncbi:MAG TPA: YhdH/YhfP family quinone oxidoreductase [Balneolaceae bacterium]|nr:YhdH/YhfP family quinone oxidoreductase [Balneolaceae bacterium]
MPDTFQALVVEEAEDGTYKRSLRQRTFEALPDEDVIIHVHYSALNYKDALSATGNKGVTKRFPHTPGIDAAGAVVESRDARFSVGDKAIVTSYDLGQNTPGGFGEYIRVPGDWVVPLPGGLTLRESMMLGTAGFTAAYGMHHLIHNGTSPADGPVLVTGATGGVGSLTVALLGNQNFDVTAATGKPDQRNYLMTLGAAKVIHRDEIEGDSSKPLLSGRWAAAIDTVGGSMLDTVLRQTRHDGTVACCGNILGGELHTSIYPFILRGVSLMGIDSGRCRMPMRKKIWGKLAADWKPPKLETICRECTLADLDREIDKILAGGQIGKVLVNLKNN